MGRIYGGVTELVGKTPVMEVRNIERERGSLARVLVKLELFNPAGSAKDRIGRAMIEDAEERGLLGKGSVIVEPTSGNTGIGLASIAASKGYRVILTMPDTMSAERRKLLAAYGAELVLTPGAGGMKGAIAKAEEIAAATPGSFIPSQFTNPANPAAHYRTTGPELWEQTDGELDVFVACVGTGGTITGTARYLKEKNPSIHVATVEPEGSPVLSGGAPGPHKIQGIGAGFVPAVLDPSVYDEVLRVRDEDAYACGRLMARREGLLVGVSSGAALWAALELASRPQYAGRTIAALLPDTGERYLSTGMFD